MPIQPNEPSDEGFEKRAVVVPGESPSVEGSGTSDRVVDGEPVRGKKEADTIEKSAGYGLLE